MVTHINASVLNFTLLIPKNYDEATWQASQFWPLYYYCADHSQALSHNEGNHFHASWNQTLLKSLNEFFASQSL